MDQLQDPLAELAARADAGQKLGLQALEFVAALGAANGKTLDFSGAAHAMEAKSLHNMDPESRLIEQRSRAIVAEILRIFARSGAPGIK
jgi:hypothetical protein